MEKQKHRDIYDDLQSFGGSGEKKKEEYTNDLIKIKQSTQPKVFRIKNNLDADVSPSQFMISTMLCPICKETKNEDVHIHAVPKKWVSKCSKCGTVVEMFTPQPLQRLILDIDAPVLNVISGYGLGKTTINMCKVNRVAQAIDGAQIAVIGARDTSINTGKDELTKFIHNAETIQQGGDLKVKNTKKWVYKNGSSVRWMSANTTDITSIRSWNFDLAVVLEASSPVYYKRHGDTNFFEELKMRMRSDLSNIQAKDANGNIVEYIDSKGRAGAALYDATIQQIILESNPSPTAIMEEVFHKSATLFITENVQNSSKLIDNFYTKYNSVNMESEIVSVLASSRDNQVLPESYFKTRFGGMPDAYVARMRDCDLTRNENQVWPEALDNEVPRKTREEILTADRIYQIFDPGSTDPSGVLYGAVWKDYQMTGMPKIHVFDAALTEGGASRKGNSFKELSELMSEMELRNGLSIYNPHRQVFEQGWLNPLLNKKQELQRIADLQIWNKGRGMTAMHDQEYITEYDQWVELGFTFEKAIKGVGSLEAGIEAVSELFESKILDWAGDLAPLREEFIRYWYAADSKGILRPEENKWNHLMDCLRYLVSAAKEFLGIDTIFSLKNTSNKSIKPKSLTDNIPVWLRENTSNRPTSGLKKKSTKRKKLK